MRRLSFLLFILAACGAADITTPDTPAAKKPRALDPYITVRIRDLLDPATAVGKAEWRVYHSITDAINPAGYVARVAALTSEARFAQTCFSAAADSIGQRMLSLLAIADTTRLAANPVPDSVPNAIARDWYNGQRTLPSGWMAISFPLTDVWDSEQFRAGRGLTYSDPIKWGWDWTGIGTARLYERAATDTTGAC